jgi:hypothetical protein
MRRHLVELGDVVPHRVGHRDAQDLLVVAFLVLHQEHADRIDDDLAARDQRLLEEDQRIERIAVAAERVLDEAVVGGVVHRGVQDAIEPQPPGVVVHLVLVAAALRDLDDDGDFHQ